VSTAKSLFLRRERDVWDSLRSQRTMLAEANERLAQRSTEVVDLRLLCDELKSVAAATRAEAASTRTEASSAREEVASLAEEMQQWRLELGQVLGELDQSRSQAAEAVSRAEALKGLLAEATGRLVEASARAEGMCHPLCSFDLASFFTSCLKNFVWLSAGLGIALSESVKNCKALAQASEQKEVDRVAMSEAISAFCRAFGLDDVPSGSSP
jgi:hypothetical protein